jgi:hypothetical protein
MSHFQKENYTKKCNVMEGVPISDETSKNTMFETGVIPSQTMIPQAFHYYKSPFGKGAFNSPYHFFKSFQEHSAHKVKVDLGK